MQIGTYSDWHVLLQKYFGKNNGVIIRRYVKILVVEMQIIDAMMKMKIKLILFMEVHK